MAAWERAGRQVRLCVDPNEPLLIERYLDLERALHLGAPASDVPADWQWEWAWRSACLLMETASDAVLPMHWRWLCLDHVHRPLDTLASLVDSEVRRRLFAGLSWQLANLRMEPGESVWAADETAPDDVPGDSGSNSNSVPNSEPK